MSEQWVWMKRGSESGKCGRMNREVRNSRGKEREAEREVCSGED